MSDIKTNNNLLEYSFKENPFESLYVDITKRCNMECSYCFNPERSPEDMPLKDFELLCSSLPFPVMIKLSGGEPTLHPEFPEFIKTAFKYGHRIYVISNGLRYTEPGFLDILMKIKRSGVRFSIGISMDGGYANRHAYEMINGRDCMQLKLDSFKAMVNSGLGRMSLTAIILRGLNEDVIPQLIELALKNDRSIRYVHFRNAGNVGRHKETKPYSIEELKDMTRVLFNEHQFQQRCIGESHCSLETGRNCCYRFRPTDRLQISLLEFYTEKAFLCHKRGRIKVGSRKIEPLFFSMDTPSPVNV
ncbi:MAG: radical SAM protein [Nitrospiraceae bacterium]|nr:radical SAM protein [Nitrospiraceae bacterium]